MQYWLFKSEPDAFGIDHLERDRTTEWTGVRNYQARNFMKTMRKGDLGFFYHSNTKPPGIVGICRVSREAYPDHTALDPKSDYYDAKASEEKPIWEMVEVEFVERFAAMLTLDDLRSHDEISEMLLLRKGQRLSIQPVTAQEWKFVTKLAKKH
jgi:predicted RNA-binding protein with PUA-like domain